MLVIRHDGCATVHQGCLTCEVRSLAVCGVLEPAELRRLEALAKHQSIARGGILFHEHDAAESVFNVTAGMIKLFKLMEDGRRQVVGFLLPGDFLGFAGQRAYDYTAEAVLPSATCRLKSSVRARRSASESFSISGSSLLISSIIGL